MSTKRRSRPRSVTAPTRCFPDRASFATFAARSRNALGPDRVGWRMPPVSALTPRLEAAADGPGAITFLGTASADGVDRERVTWAALHDDARGMAAALQARGVAPDT